jgi:hypothetical protein
VNRYVITCVTLSLVFAGLYIADTNGVFKKVGRPIAQIKDSLRTVRRLPNDGLTWDRARKGTQLEIGDTISTGDRAEAKIVFNAGGLLTLDSGSMVVLSGDPEELHLNFLTGGAHLQVTKEGQTKIKIVQPSAKPTKSKRIRAAVEVTWVEQLAQPEVASKRETVIKSELNDPPLMVPTKVALKAPDLLEPKPETRFLYPLRGSQSVAFSWVTVENVKTYHLYVENASGATFYDGDLNNTKYVLENLEPGEYLWSVYSVSESLQFSNSSVTRKFTIDDVPKVEWVGDSQNQTFYYVTPKPSLKAEWTLSAKMSEKSPSFRVTIQSTNNTAQIFVTKNYSKVINLAKDGVYEEKIELISETGAPLSGSSVKKINVLIYPLLPPPKFNAREPASIQATRSGAIELGWVAVPKAQSYAVSIVDSKALLIREGHSRNSSYSTKGLLPGDYFIKLASVDAYGRLGPYGLEKKIHVPDVSDVKGPTFKKFEIK